MDMDWGTFGARWVPSSRGSSSLLVFLSVYSLAVSHRALVDLPARRKKQSVKFALEIGQLLKQEKLQGSDRPREEVQGQPRREGRLGRPPRVRLRGPRRHRRRPRHRRGGRARHRARHDDDDGRHEEGPRRPRHDRHDGAVRRPPRRPSSASSTRSTAWRPPAPAASARSRPASPRRSSTTAARPLRRHPGRLALQLLPQQDRALPGRDVELRLRARRLLHEAAGARRPPEGCAGLRIHEPAPERRRIRHGHGSFGGRQDVKSDINVTPLVDVVLVLLIIFMVVTPMLQKGKPVLLPQTDKPGQEAGVARTSS